MSSRLATWGYILDDIPESEFQGDLLDILLGADLDLEDDELEDEVFDFTVRQ